MCGQSVWLEGSARRLFPSREALSGSWALFSVPLEGNLSLCMEMEALQLQDAGTAQRHTCNMHMGCCRLRGSGSCAVGVKVEIIVGGSCSPLEENLSVFGAKQSGSSSVGALPKASQFSCVHYSFSTPLLKNGTE